MSLEPFDEENLPESPWKIYPPEVAGTYEFTCGEWDYEPQTVEVFEQRGELWAIIDGETRPLQMWHDNLTDPQWK